MEKILYLECNSGISGDMTVGALLDLGASRERLEQGLKSLKVDGYHLHFGRTKKCGIDAFDFDVHLEEGAEHGHEHVHEHDHSPEHDHSHEHGHGPESDHAHDHDHPHGHGYPQADENYQDHHHFHDSDRVCACGDVQGEHIHSCEPEAGPGHEPGHPHGTEHDHAHSHDHPHDHHGHSHVHRNLHDIYEIIDRLDDREEVKALTRKMFEIVAEAESKAHGLPIEEVHFHEVGAVDSIVDIVSTAILLDDLGIKNVIVSPLAEGRGYVRCQHGVMPVPVPATANIAAAHGLELHFTDNEGEMVTPTGAAIAAAIGSGEELPAHYTIEKIGIGAGNKDFKQANILRAMILCPKEEKPDTLWKLETNIDDCTGEALGYTMEKLMEAGALDAYYTAIQMKKNRPAYELSVVCRESEREALEEVIFLHTTTIGIRRYPLSRTVLDRRPVTVETDWGRAEAKICGRNGREFIYPEYESVRELCKNSGLSFQEAYACIQRAAEKGEKN